jgi:nucleotide-binding universal stress UspA family protein
MLQQAIGSTWAKDHRVKLNSHVGNEVEEIVKYATDHEIDLIVLGTHGYRGFTHFIIGSVAEKVVRMATCPVLTVHPKGHQFVCDASSGQDASAPVS